MSKISLKKFMSFRKQLISNTYVKELRAVKNSFLKSLSHSSFFHRYVYVSNEARLFFAPPDGAIKLSKKLSRLRFPVTRLLGGAQAHALPQFSSQVCCNQSNIETVNFKKIACGKILIV